MLKEFFISLRIFILMLIITGVFYTLAVHYSAQRLFPKEANGSLILKDSKIIGSKLIAQKFSSDKYFWSRPSAVDYNGLGSGGSNLSATSKTLQEAIKNREENLEKSVVDAEIEVQRYTPQNRRVAKRTSSRQRRTNDRSVLRVISGDAEDAKHANGSYPSKQKYKLDESSLHEDHEDDENAEIEVWLHAKDLLSSSASGLDPHISPNSAIYQLNRVIKSRKLNIEEKAKVLKLIKLYTEDRDLGILGEKRVNVLLLNKALDESFR